MNGRCLCIRLCVAVSIGGAASNLSGCASQSKSCCGETAPSCSTAASPRDEVERNVIVLGDDLSALRAEFNKRSDRWRTVALVSPTCSECVYGAEVVRKELTDRYPADRVETISIWIPMLSTDNEQAARNSASIFPPEGVRQFYDSRQSVGWAYARGTFNGFIGRARKSLPPGHYLEPTFADREQTEQPQWDLYMLYAPGVRWNDAPPMPTHWIRHCGRPDGQKSTYWRDSPDSPPREGNLFDAMREMADQAVGRPTVRADDSPLRLEILGFDGCPNTPVVTANVDQALASLGIRADVVYIDQMKLPDGDLRRGWPTPTVLVSGRDLFGMQPPQSAAMSCRAYAGGAPSAAEIATALKPLTRQSTSADQLSPR